MRRSLALTALVASGCLAVEPTWQGASMSGQAGGSTDGTGSDGGTTAGPGDSDSGSGSGDGEGSAGDGSESTGDDGGPPTDALPADCGDLPPVPADAIVVSPDDNATLAEIIGDAPAGSTIALEPGTYDRSGLPQIFINAPNITLRSTTAAATDVVLDAGGGPLEHVIRVMADDVLIADLTIENNSGTLIFIRPEDEVISRPSFYRLILNDAGDNKIEVRASLGAGGWVDDGVIACCEFGMSDTFRDAQTDCTDVGAIRVQGGADWIVRDNLVQDHWCTTPTYAVIAFDNGARDTQVVRNRMLDNYRGILIGGDEPDSPRVMSEPGCGPSPVAGWGHVGGLVENNVIWVGEPQLEVIDPVNSADSMISFWRTCGAAAIHNTIVTEVPIFNSIEWRWPETSVTIANNLATNDMQARDGAFAIGVASNTTDAALSEFVQPAQQDFHLAPGAAAVDAGNVVAGLPSLSDYDGNPRVGAPDLGAYERTR
ncbi:MAG: choice-of-anchor Q domain-containing protein [Myxococcota bacterium]